MIEPERQTDRRAVGVFDSGVGGLTVLHECLVNLPQEDYLYLGDTRNFPYGPKSLAEVRRLAFTAIDYLVEQDVKLISGSLQLGRRRRSAPAPGRLLHPHHRSGHPRRLGGRAGDAQSQGRSHGHRGDGAVERLPEGPADPGCGIGGLSHGLSAVGSLIQAGDVFSEETEAAARECVAPLKEAEVDTVILGCTHYPLVTPMLRRLLGPRVSLIDSAEETAREVSAILERKGMTNDAQEEGDYRFVCTGDSEEFREVGARFLQLPIREVTRL